jgi:corrinoid protein of di/trimethylamine methyltransferase
MASLQKEIQKEIKEEIQKAVLDFDRKAVEKLTRQALAEGAEPLALFDAVRETITRVGEDFARGALFLPHLVGAAEAMEGGMPLIMEEIKRRGETPRSLGTVAIGTVFGDIHSIGKTMVATMLSAGGYTVRDLGVNVPAADFVRAVADGGVEVLAMSALLTTTAPEQRRVIEALEEKGLRERVKVIVGGGAISQEFADEIGADGYGSTAPGAVELVKKVIGK